MSVIVAGVDTIESHSSRVPSGQVILIEVSDSPSATGTSTRESWLA